MDRIFGQVVGVLLFLCPFSVLHPVELRILSEDAALGSAEILVIPSSREGLCVDSFHFSTDDRSLVVSAWKICGNVPISRIPVLKVSKRVTTMPLKVSLKFSEAKPSPHKPYLTLNCLGIIGSTMVPCVAISPLKT